MKHPLLSRRELLASGGAAAIATPAFGAAAPTAGPIAPTWASLARHYRVPDWFRDAKFGIWAHWGPQCQPEFGDWYARLMYMQGGRRGSMAKPPTNTICGAMAIPSRTGFIDIIGQWKAEHWQPEDLLSRYVKAGARYFMAMGMPPRQFRPLREQAPRLELDAGRAEARHPRHMGAAGAEGGPQVRHLEPFEPCLALVSARLWL